MNIWRRLARKPLKTISLQDSFSGSAIDTSKWTVTADSGTSALQMGGRLKLIGPAAGTTGYVSVASKNTYDLTNKSVFISMPRIATRSRFESFCESYPIQIGLDATHFFDWAIWNGGLTAHDKNGGSRNDLYSTTYSATTHRWFRIRHQTSDNKIYWDTAPATASNPPLESQWVNRFSETAPFAITAIGVSVTLGAWSGPSVDTGTLSVDGFNCPAVFTGTQFRSQFETNNFTEWSENEGGNSGVELNGGAVTGGEALLEISTATVHSGTHSAKLSIRAESGITNPKSGLARNDEPGELENIASGLYYSSWFYIPVRVDIDEPFGWWMITEWQHEGVGLAWNQIDIINRGGAPGGAMYLTFIRHPTYGGGEWAADVGKGEPTVAGWNHLETFYKPGSSSDGIVQSWLNGVEWLNQSGLTLSGSGETTRYQAMNYGELHSSASPTVIYFDDIEISTTRVGYNP